MSDSLYDYEPPEPTTIEAVKRSGNSVSLSTTYDPDWQSKWRAIQESLFGLDKWELGSKVSFDDFGMRGVVEDREIRDGLVSAVQVKFEQGLVWIRFGVA
jgi:hypothetical protein